MNGTIADPYTPTSEQGKVFLSAAIKFGNRMPRRYVARMIRTIRDKESAFNARHALAWLDWLGAYPLKESNR